MKFCRSLSSSLQRNRQIGHLKLFSPYRYFSTSQQISKLIADDTSVLVVLDDDPTGCQTTYDINVLLEYTSKSILSQLSSDEKLFYILTNTRAMNEKRAIQTTKQALSNLKAAVQEKGDKRPIRIISRGDSTLRGHFSAETLTILDCIDSFDGIIFCPAFFEGNRVTRNDIHYLIDGDKSIPVGETPFAKDPHFGYNSSNLIDWVKEKLGNKSHQYSIRSISLEEIRQENIDGLMKKLIDCPKNSIFIVNGK
jgi:uncharacterized protein YgbK (DUF1537 family)